MNRSHVRSLLRDARDVLRRGIKIRFPELFTPEVLEAINDQPSLDLLIQWQDAAFGAQTAEDLLAVLRR